MNYFFGSGLANLYLESLLGIHLYGNIFIVPLNSHIYMETKHFNRSTKTFSSFKLDTIRPPNTCSVFAFTLMQDC
jgi:hypothetical protein